MHKIVFSGKILSGHDPAKVRDKLLSMLGVGPEQAERLFSGKSLTVKKGLSAEEAQRYVEHLNRRGIGVEVDPPLPPAGSSPFPTLIFDDEPEEPVEQPPSPPPQVFVQAVAEPPAAFSSSTAGPRAKPIPAPKTKWPEPAIGIRSAAAPVSRPAGQPSPRPAMAENPGRDPAASPVNAIGEALGDQVTCPQCGEVQPKRTLCRACAIDMPRFAAARQPVFEASRTDGQERRASVAAAGMVSARDGESTGPGWLSLSFEGRFGRLSYLWATVFMWFVLVGGLYTAIKTSSLLLGFGILIVTLIYSIRLMVLRNHDAGWSGWWALISLVPYVNIAYSLMLIFIPGTKGANLYGVQPARAGKFAAAMGICCLIFIFGIFSSAFRLAMNAYEEYHKGMESEEQASSVQTSAGTSSEILIYTIASCPACAEAKSYLRRNKISFEERDVERNDAFLREFNELGGKGVPLVIVNGRSMSGFNPARFEALRGG